MYSLLNKNRSKEKSSLFPLIFTIGFILIFAIPGLSAPSYTCEGEDVANINGATSSQTMTYLNENSTGSDNYSRYFKFKTQVDGNITIALSDLNNNTQRMRIGTSCGDNNIYGSGNQNVSASKSF